MSEEKSVVRFLRLASCGQKNLSLYCVAYSSSSIYGIILPDLYVVDMVAEIFFLFFFGDITRYRSTHMHPLGQIWRRKCGCRMVFICKIFLVLLSQHIRRLSNSCCLLGLVGIWFLGVYKTKWS